MFEVKVFDPNGKLKRIIPPDELKAKYREPVLGKEFQKERFHMSEMKKSPYGIRECSICGEEFSAKAPLHTTCSESCRAILCKQSQARRNAKARALKKERKGENNG